MNEEPINPQLAADLDAMRRESDAKRAAAAAAEEEAAARRVEEWERRMHRIFKGIITKRQRRQNLIRSLERGDLG